MMDIEIDTALSKLRTKRIIDSLDNKCKRGMKRDPSRVCDLEN